MVAVPVDMAVMSVPMDAAGVAVPLRVAVLVAVVPVARQLAEQRAEVEVGHPGHDPGAHGPAGVPREAAGALVVSVLVVRRARGAVLLGAPGWLGGRRARGAGDAGEVHGLLAVGADVHGPSLRERGHTLLYQAAVPARPA
jgi:hypothetical protein